MGNNYRSIDPRLDTLKDVKNKVWLMGCVGCCRRRFHGPAMAKKEKALKHHCLRANRMVRLAGIEPTTPWFVAKYSIQLSYSRNVANYSLFKHAKWWAVTDLNCGPKDYESSALTN